LPLCESVVKAKMAFGSVYFVGSETPFARLATPLTKSFHFENPWVVAWELGLAACNQLIDQLIELADCYTTLRDFKEKF
jgi:hypothetical protein